MIRELLLPDASNASYKETSLEASWRTEKFNDEIHLMQWLKKSTTIPLPEIYHIHVSDRDHPHTFFFDATGSWDTFDEYLCGFESRNEGIYALELPLVFF